MQTRGEGVKKSENFADIISRSSPSLRVADCNVTSTQSKEHAAGKAYQLSTWRQKFRSNNPITAPCANVTKEQRDCIAIRTKHSNVEKRLDSTSKTAINSPRIARLYVTWLACALWRSITATLFWTRKWRQINYGAA